jgi:DEAD/DEAH box helicase domain-containing protein
LRLRYWWPGELANLSVAIPVSPGFVLFNDAHLHDEPKRHLVWRRWLWLFNIFQTLPGFLLATQEGLEAGDHSVFGFAKGARVLLPHQARRGQCTRGCLGGGHRTGDELPGRGIAGLMDAGLSPPDEVGYELEQAGSVVAEAELAWVAQKLVLLMPAQADSAAVWQVNGWETWMADGPWPQQIG